MIRGVPAPNGECLFAEVGIYSVKEDVEFMGLNLGHKKVLPIEKQRI